MLWAIIPIAIVLYMLVIMLVIKIGYKHIKNQLNNSSREKIHYWEVTRVRLIAFFWPITMPVVLVIFTIMKTYNAIDTTYSTIDRADELTLQAKGKS